MKTPSRNLIIFLCIIKLILGACDEAPEIVIVTTEEVTTEVIEELKNTEDTTEVLKEFEESTTFKLDLEVLAETTTVALNLEDITQETTTTPSDEDDTTQNTNELLETLETTTTTPQELTTTPSTVDFEMYAVNQMNFILDHILQTSYDFVSQVLQESDNSFNQRDKLKLYAELLQRLLKDYNEEDSHFDHSTEDSYNSILKKWTFLKGKGTRYLHKYLPSQWLQSYANNKQEISMWLDKTAEQMHEEFNTYVSQDDDQVKFQYFNEAFDDIPRANEIHQKLTILADLVKIATNKKQISFMDLYMQS